MKKLYSVKEIAELLNKELEQQGADYRYTEERVRSRLRYLRSKGVHGDEGPLVTATVLGYDKRAKFYSEEDVEKLRHIWIGPMLPEFEVRDEDVRNSDTDDNEVLVRPVDSQDLDRLAAFLPPLTDAASDVRSRLTRLLKQAGSRSFVATSESEDIIGWVNAEISSATSLARGANTGIIRIYLPLDVKEREPAARGLILRSQWWLIRQQVSQIVIEIPAEMADLEPLFESMRLQPEGAMRYYRADTL